MPSLDKCRGSKWRGRVKIDGIVKETKLFGTGPKKGPEWMKARQWELDRRQEILSGFQPSLPKELPLLEWAVEYLEDAKTRCADKTFVEKRSVVERFLSFAKDVQLTQVKADLARRYLKLQADTRSGYAANKDRKTLMNAWEFGRDYLVDKGFPLKQNPFKAVKPFPVEHKERHVPTWDEFWTVLEAAQGQDRVMLLTFIQTGARKAEVFRLKWSDVDFVERKVRLRTQKTRGKGWREDWLPLTDELCMELAKWKEDRPYKTDWVFTQLDDTPSPNHRPGEPFVSRQHFLKRLCKRAGVKAFDWHSIRHLTAVSLYKSGQRKAVVQLVLRHQAAGTTETYLRSLGLDMEEMRGGLEGLTGRGFSSVVTLENKNPQSCRFEGLGNTTGEHTRLN